MAPISNAKSRLDQLLVDRHLAPSRTQAQALIMAGQVTVNGQVSSKPGHTIKSDADIVVTASAPYVSRAGEKLASVAEVVGFEPKDQVVLDVGSSTGGFTDYSLQHGASHVQAVDVGNYQLHPKLRNDARVSVHERTDIRSLTELDPRPTLAVIDVSFISLTAILESVAKLLPDGAPIYAMVKPQFEAGKAIADKYRGVIKDEKVRQQILDNLKVWLAANGFQIEAEADSAVHGAKGNREHFMVLHYTP